MVKRSIAAVLGVVMVCSTVAMAAPATIKLTKGRIAVSHDGNAYDKDDIYATAMDFAVMAAFGMQKRLVHLHHSVFQSNNDPSFHTQEQKAALGWKEFPGYGDGSFVFDAWKNMEKTAAHFKVQADQSTADDKIYFALAGPMHVPYLCIQATAKEKRQFIHCVSHSEANENMKSGVSGGKTWADIKSTFGGDKVTTEDIKDQNANLGGVGHDKWTFLSTMTEKEGIKPSAWTWLWSMDWKGNGDCSDNGMVWYIITGDLNGTAAKYGELFKNPYPMESGPNTIALPSKSGVSSSNNPLSVSFTQNNKVLDVNVSGMTGNGSVGIYNLRSQQIGKASLRNGQAQLALDRGTTGNYIMTVESQGQKVAKQILLK